MLTAVILNMVKITLSTKFIPERSLRGKPGVANRIKGREVKINAGGSSTVSRIEEGRLARTLLLSSFFRPPNERKNPMDWR